MAGEFDKDFGYLMPFLDKVAAASGSIADPAARAELSKLVADEKVRWARIRDLLGGAAGQTTPAVKAGPAATSITGNASPPDAASIVRSEPHSFTVGSLRPKRT